jgi:hypothetical protein
MNIAAPPIRGPMARLYDTFTAGALDGVLICNAETLALTGHTPASARARIVARKALRLAEHAADQASDATLSRLLRAVIAAQDAEIELGHHDAAAVQAAQQAAQALLRSAQDAVDDWGLEG